MLAPALRPRPCRGSEFFTAPLPGGWADSVSERLCGCKQPATRRRSLWFRAPVRGRGRRPGGSAKRAGGWVKILPQRERQSCRYPIRRGASRFGRSCPRAAGPAGGSPISRREQNKKSLLQNGSRDLVKLWTHRAAGREPHKENRTLPPAGRSLSRSRCPVQSKSPRSQKQEQGLGFLEQPQKKSTIYCKRRTQVTLVPQVSDSGKPVSFHLNAHPLALSQYLRRDESPCKYWSAAPAHASLHPPQAALRRCCHPPFIGTWGFAPDPILGVWQASRYFLGLR